MKRITVLTAAAALFFIILISVGGSSAVTASRIKEPFRIHIIANSDSDADQAAKLAVRDAILEYTRGLTFGGADDAESYAALHRAGLEDAADGALEKSGMSYKTRAYVGEFWFPVRTYDNVSYPEGRYRALELVAGKGAGRNWWCVMFPPLCIVDGEKRPEEGVEIRSFVGDLINRLLGNKMQDSEQNPAITG